MPDYFDSELNTIELEGEIAIGGGEGGTTNYPDLTNKPQINGIELIGNLTAVDLGLSTPDDIANAILAILPTGTESGGAATFKTSLVLPLVSCSVDVSATKVYQRGANLWDGDWEVGTYNTNTGAKSSSTTRIRSKNLIPIAPDSTLYFTQIGTGVGLSFLFYDKDGTFKSGFYRGSTTGGFAYNTQSDWHYLAISPGDAYGTTYNNDIAIRLDNSYDYVAYNSNSNEYAVADLANIRTFDGVNTLFADSGNINVTYKKSIDDAIAELQALIL